MMTLGRTAEPIRVTPSPTTVSLMPGTAMPLLLESFENSLQRLIRSFDTQLPLRHET
jgi:hypothetical protein